MKFLCRIKKCEQAVFLFFVVCVVQAAPMAEQDSKFLDEQLDNFALVIDEQILMLEGVATLPQQQVEPLQNKIDKSKEQQNQPDIKLDKPEVASADLNRGYEQPGKDDVFFNTTINGINSSGRVDTNTLVNEFRFDNEETSPVVFNQNGIIQNNEQLKMLAHNVFSEETLEDVLMVQQEVKMLVNQADAWIKDVLFDDSNWRLEDSIYGSAAIMFINDSSLIRFLKKLDENSDDINQIRKQLEQQNSPDKESTLVPESELVKGYISIMEFWNNYASTLIYLVLSIVIAVELFKLISKALKPKKKRKSRRGSRRNSRRVQKKEKLPTIPFSDQGTVASNSAASSGVARREKHKQTSRRHHHNRRHRVKRSWVRKVLDETFSDVNKNR